MFSSENQSNRRLGLSVTQHFLSNFSGAAWAWDRDVTTQDYSRNAVSWVSDSVASQSPSSTLWRHNGWAGSGTTGPEMRRIPGKDCCEESRYISTVIWIKSQIRWISNVGCCDRLNCFVYSFLLLGKHWIGALAQLTCTNRWFLVVLAN